MGRRTLNFVSRYDRPPEEVWPFVSDTYIAAGLGTVAAAHSWMDSKKCPDFLISISLSRTHTW